MYIFTYTDCTWNRHRAAELFWLKNLLCKKKEIKPWAHHEPKDWRHIMHRLVWLDWISWHWGLGLARESPQESLKGWCFCFKNKPGRFGQASPFKGHRAQQSTKNVQGTFFHGNLKGTPPKCQPLTFPSWALGGVCTHKFAWLFITSSHSHTKINLG